MKERKQRRQTWKFPKMIFLFFFVCIIILFIRYIYIALSPNVNKINLKEFAKNRNTVSKVLTAKRGSIFDATGNILAQNVTSYTLIAYLDKSRKKGNYVKDIDATAKALASVLDADENDIKSKLQKGKDEGKYQVEFGSSGKNITELKKSEIEKLGLDGLGFTEDYKRYYPNGNFASYIIGYAKTNEKVSEGKTLKSIDGELGIEAKFDDILKGTDGYLSYQQDRFGYKIPDTAETRTDALDGNDIYLTIDSSIQRFVETEMQTLSEKYDPKWAVIGVVDAKTGDVLAVGSIPSFNPNTRDITSYENPLVSTAFEPGSTMKIYTYMCAIEKGTYKGDDTFKSGTIQVADATIKDWNNTGWGTITFDKGFEYSSNVGVTSMIDKFINKDDLKNCFRQYGFGKLTGIDVAKEVSGNLGFKYPVEVANASFGQGINTTAIQHLQALTILSNNGKMLNLHVVSKIVDSNTGKTTYTRKVKESKNIVSQATVNKVKELMYNVVNSEDAGATGKRYKIDGFDIIGKTGTAQIYNEKSGGYLKGDTNYIYSFSGMYPKDNPEIIIYAAVKQPNVGATVVVSDAVNSLMKNIAKYKNMFSENNNEVEDIKVVKLDSYINQKTEIVKANLESDKISVVLVGNGDKIISQYPKKGSKVLSYDKVFLITNDGENKMPDLTGYSRSDVIGLMKTLGYDYQIDGYGYVTNQSIKAGDLVNGQSVKITLSEKFKEE